MTEDILKYYNLNSNDYTFGLFTTRMKDRHWSDQVTKSIHGVSYTQYINAADYRINDNLSLLDMFHGLCATYMSYFITMNPDWTPMEMRRLNFWNSLIHVFATKTINGITYFADARGITDNCLEFFNDYRFSKNNMNVQIDHNLPELEYEDMLTMKAAYDMIYHDKSISI